MERQWSVLMGFLRLVLDFLSSVAYFGQLWWDSPASRGTVPPIPWPGIAFHRLQSKKMSPELLIGPLSPNLERALHILQFVLFLLQLKDVIGYLAEVRNEIFDIALGLGYFLGTYDPRLRGHCDGS